MEHVAVERNPERRVATVEMAYGEDNQLGPALVGELQAAFDALADDPDVRAVVLTGRHPKFFCNGLELRWLMTHANDPAAVGEFLASLNALYHRITLFPKPVVAAVNGHTFGGGFFLAAHADFRIMREDRGWACLPESDINIPLLPGMIAICEAIMPPQGFRQFYFTGQRVAGPRCKELGFADDVASEDELRPRAVELAAMLGRKRTATYTEMKRRIRHEVGRILLEEDPGYFHSTLALAMG